MSLSPTIAVVAQPIAMCSPPDRRCLLDLIGHARDQGGAAMLAEAGL